MEIVNIGVKHGSAEVVFHLRVISVAEENRYAARFLAIPDKDTEERKAELEYSIFVDSLAAWSEEPLTARTESGDESLVYPGINTPADSVKEFFKEKTPYTERIAPAVIGRYRMKLQPDVVFY